VQYVWDYFDYTQNAEWFREVGYPLLKGVVQFWLATLVEDEYFKDGTLVSNPCYSPEHGNAVSLQHLLFCHLLVRHPQLILTD
jgi:alpha-L-fucosidase 2